MRNWMRERMKRRKKKPENETEATGKVGQQKPVVDELHPGPIVPTYGSEPHQSVAETAPADERRMETEVQPDSPSVPPPEQRPVQGVQGGKAPSRAHQDLLAFAIWRP